MSRANYGEPKKLVKSEMELAHRRYAFRVERNEVVFGAMISSSKDSPVFFIFTSAL